MPLSSFNLGPIDTLASSITAIYANPASTTSHLRGIQLHNTAGTEQTVELYEVPDSSGSLGTPAATNRFFKQALAPDETRWINFPAVLTLTAENYSIQGKATTADVVTIKLFGGVSA